MKFDRNSWAFRAVVQTAMAAAIALLLFAIVRLLPGDLAAWLGGVLLLFGPMLLIVYRMHSKGFTDGDGDGTSLSWEEREYGIRQTEAFFPVQLVMIGLWIGAVGEHPFLPTVMFLLFFLVFYQYTTGEPPSDWGRVLRSGLTIAGGVIVGHWLRAGMLQQ